jgi:hypothetical protein
VQRRKTNSGICRVILILLAAIQIHAAQTPGRILDRPEAYAVAPVPWLAAKYNNKKVLTLTFAIPKKHLENS